MSDKDLLSPDRLAYFRDQTRTGRLILVTGAGFSTGAMDRNGKPLPVGRALAQELWALCYGVEPLDDESTLADVFQHVVARRRTDVVAFLQQRFSVRADTIPDHYLTWFSFPWERIYTLNIDDLERATDRRFELPREPLTISGTRPPTTIRVVQPNERPLVEVIHLNGTLDDVPDYITFSTSQYGRRLASQEPTYHRFVTDLASHPFVFVGTPLDEAMLWQHIELRGEKGVRGLRELRPRSFLVSLGLNRARQELLKEYNVEWVKASAESFASVLRELRAAADAGLKRFTTSAPRKASIPVVSDLIRDDDVKQSSLYLLGSEPEWRDILSGRAILRSNDHGARESAEKMIGAARSAKRTERAAINRAIIITGTAGCGKSTTLMRLAASVSAQGISTAYITSEIEASPKDVHMWAKRSKEPVAVFIDDADRYGSELGALIADLQGLPDVLLVASALRASKLDKCLQSSRLTVQPIEQVVPGLSDDDIIELIAALDRENKLGALKGKTPAEREKAFREKAGRQLLVAMLEATSGKRFEERVTDEWGELQDEAKLIYSLVALATTLRYGLKKDEILLGVGDFGSPTPNNAMLNALNALVVRGIIVANPDGSGHRARHRAIADILIDELRNSGRLGSVHARLAYVAAANVSPQLPRRARPWRIVKAILNHDHLYRMTGLDGGRDVYNAVEGLLNWDYHYLLQRGSLEVEVGSIQLAENYLSQAFSLAPDDPLVRTEYAYMIFKKATLAPNAINARELVDQAAAMLREQIDTRGRDEYVPAHILGSQTIAWCRKARLTPSEKQKLLREAVDDVTQAIQWHPRSKDLNQLHSDMKMELMKLTIAD